MKASSGNKDCLPWGLIFYRVGLALSEQCGGAHEKSVRLQEGRTWCTSLCCTSHLAPSVEPSAGALVLNTKGGYREPTLRVKCDLTKLN